MFAVIGDVVQDIVVWQEEEVRPATDTKSTIYITRGGSAANVAAFAGPRTQTRFIGCVGDDLAGVALTKELSSHGVEPLMQVRGNTGTIVVQIDQSGERTMFPSRGASGMLEKVNTEWLSGVDILHITAYSLEVNPTRDSVIGAAQAVHAGGGKVCFDVSSLYTMDSMGIESFLDYMGLLAPDIISANQDESTFLRLAECDIPGPNLTRFPNATLLSRNGAEATRVFRSGKLIEVVPVQPVDNIRDLTGAGDAFNAGYVSSRLNDGDNPRLNVEKAHSLSRLVLSCPGASEPDITQSPEA